MTLTNTECKKIQKPKMYRKLKNCRSGYLDNSEYSENTRGTCRRNTRDTGQASRCRELSGWYCNWLLQERTRIHMRSHVFVCVCTRWHLFGIVRLHHSMNRLINSINRLLMSFSAN